MAFRSRTRASRGVLVAASFALIAAACGSSSKAATTTAAPATTVASTTAAPATTSGSTATTAGSTATTAGGAATTAAAAGSAGCPAIDSSIDAQEGTGAGRFISDLSCADKKPLKAVGDPIIVGFQNAEGDPNGSFPEFSLVAQAAVNYINNELGGLGADIQNGKPGRPIQLEVCKMVISPDDSQRCANELLAKKPTVVFSSINFFGNQFPIVITPITVGDFTTPGVYSIGGGGGCLGVHTGLVYYATQELKAKKVAVPWADTPPGVVCYYDLENKPLDVLQGAVKGTSKLAGSEPDLTHMGVSVEPASPVSAGSAGPRTRSRSCSPARASTSRR
jgi:branched-chain amino acid transport system substrate-binding protein